MSTKTISYICKECEQEFEVEVEYTKPIPAQTYGPPENCYPKEGGEVNILGDEECPHCQCVIDGDKIESDLWDILADEKYDYSEEDGYDID